MKVAKLGYTCTEKALTPPASSDRGGKMIVGHRTPSRRRALTLPFYYKMCNNSDGGWDDWARS